MSQVKVNIRGTYLIMAYVCLLALLFVSNGLTHSFVQVTKWLAFPLLIIFFYINTAIDSKFEKNILYGISLFTMSSLLPIAESVIGVYTNYIILGLWIIAYFSYTRALISITSGSSSVLFQNKWLAVLLFILGLVGLYFSLIAIPGGIGSKVGLICLGLTSILYFLATINLWNQLSGILYGLYIIGAILLIGFNCLAELNFSSNISIFEERSSVLFYLGHLLIILSAVKSSLHFRNNDFTDIARVLKK